MVRGLMASPLDIHVPAALVHVIVLDYLSPAAWATLLQTCSGWDAVALAAKCHPWAGRARMVRDALNGGRPREASLSETLAVLHHCAVGRAAGAGGGAGRMVVVNLVPALELSVRTAGAPNEPSLTFRAHDVEIRCPEASWRPWMPLAIRFGAAPIAMQRVRRTAAPIPPVVEFFARDPRDALALGDMAEYLQSRGEVGRVPNERCAGAVIPRCDVFVMARRKAIAWLDDFAEVEKRHTSMTPDELCVTADRRLAKLPPRGNPDDDARTLWAIIVPPDESESDPRPDDADAATPAAHLAHVVDLTRAIARNAAARPS